jgi:hypothetical protein
MVDRRKRLLFKQPGFILIASLLILALLMAGGVGAILSMQTDLKSSGNLKTGRQAFYIAEAGLNRTWQELNDGDGINDFSAVSNNSGSLILYQNELFAGGSHTTVAEPLAGSGRRRVKVTSNGCFPAGDPCPSGSSKSVIEAQFIRGSLFGCLICSTGSVVLAGGATTDSYDSRRGPYDSSQADSSGHVHSHGDLTVTGAGTAVGGDALAGGQVVISNGAAVEGTAKERVASPPRSPVAPCGPPYHDGSGITGGSYDPFTGELRGTTTATIALVSGTYCFSSVNLAQGSSLIISGPVQIFLTDHSDFSGGDLVNTTGNVENLMIFSSVSSSSQGVLLSGGSSAYMTVYAPRAKVTLMGNSDLFGAIVGGTIVNTGAVRLHYDQKLIDNEDGSVTLASWKEVF